MSRDTIKITGARQHNLQDLTLEIPRFRLVVMTGVSGSGKSSLAFDTLYAEGQRRYVESLSAFARQFLDRLEKPDVDFIDGLSPAIAIEQRTSTPNPRSTVATSTEIYDYLRVLYAAAGQPHDPETGEAIGRSTVPGIAAELAALDEGTRLMVLAPLVRGEPGDGRRLFERLQKQGFVRVRVDGEVRDLEEIRPLAREEAHDIDVVVDRIVVREGVRSRLEDSLHTVLKLTRTEVLALVQAPGDDGWMERAFTTEFANPRTGFRMPELTPRLFSFNSHEGACPRCHGLGSVLVCDPELLVADASKSIADGAVRTWWARNKKLKAVQDRQIAGLLEFFGLDAETPFQALPEEFRTALLRGTGSTAVPAGYTRGANTRVVSKPFEGLANQAERLHETSESEITRRNVRRFLAPHPCPACAGRRLRPAVLAVTLEGTDGRELGIDGFTALPVGEARQWLAGLRLSDAARGICAEVVREIDGRLRFLERVGLGYLTLARESGTLSGGEAQRIRLASQIGGGLSGVLYVLDEPSIGLHQSDNDRLIATLEDLRDLGNTVIVVEHDEDTIRAADHVVDLGPGAGPHGGRIMAAGTPEEIAADERSPTGRYLSGRDTIPVPRQRLSPPPRDRSLLPDEDGDVDTGWVTVHGAAENNLRDLDAAFPVGCLTCVTGVSGSGKSTLVDTILRRSVFRHLYRSKEAPGRHRAVTGLGQFDRAIVVDQSPIGRTPRSNAATYIGAFNPIRSLFASLPAAKVRGYGPGHFSFNVEGGRCEACKGDGSIRIDMHFLSDVYVTCEACEGRRFNAETLEITFKGRHIAEVLEMTAEEARRFFAKVPAVADRLALLVDVGLGYLRLGQPGTTLSGGEAQRVKLSAELGRRSTGRTLFLLDEPTTGLHFADIEKLLAVLARLRDAGNTLVVIEHNLDVIKCADWVIDLGPGGGTDGGALVIAGTPEQVAGCRASVTGRYLAPKLFDPHPAEPRGAARRPDAGR